MNRNILKYLTTPIILLLFISFSVLNLNNKNIECGSSKMHCDDNCEMDNHSMDKLYSITNPDFTEFGNNSFFSKTSDNINSNKECITCLIKENNLDKKSTTSCSTEIIQEVPRNLSVLCNVYNNKPFTTSNINSTNFKLIKTDYNVSSTHFLC